MWSQKLHNYRGHFVTHLICTYITWKHFLFLLNLKHRGAILSAELSHFQINSAENKEKGETSSSFLLKKYEAPSEPWRRIFTCIVLKHRSTQLLENFHQDQLEVLLHVRLLVIIRLLHTTENTSESIEMSLHSWNVEIKKKVWVNELWISSWTILSGFRPKKIVGGLPITLPWRITAGPQTASHLSSRHNRKGQNHHRLSLAGKVCTYLTVYCSTRRI